MIVIYRLRKTAEREMNLKLHIVPKALHEFGRIMQTDKAFINCVIRPFLFYRRDRKEKVRKKIFYFFLLSVKIVYAKSIHYFLYISCMLFVYVNEGYT